MGANLLRGKEEVVVRRSWVVLVFGLLTFSLLTWGSEPTITVKLDKPFYNLSLGETTVTVEVTDISANRDPARTDTVEVKAESTSDQLGIKVTLTETGANTGEFRGTFQLVTTLPAPADKLYVQKGDTITVTYTTTNGYRATAGVLDSTIQLGMTAEMPDLVRQDPTARTATITVSNPTGGFTYDQDLELEVVLDAPTNFTDRNVIEVSEPSANIEVASRTIDAGNLVLTFSTKQTIQTGSTTLSFKLKATSGAPLGTYNVTVKLIVPEEWGGEEYLAPYLLAQATDTMTVSEAAALMVDYRLPGNATAVPAGTETDITLTFRGSDFQSPDGPPNGEQGGNRLNWVKARLEVPVGQVLESNQLTTGQYTFEGVLANDASADILVTVWGEQDDGTKVGPVTLTIPVEGYKVTYTPTTTQYVDSTADIEVIVKTKDGVPVNNATVVIEMADTFEKTINGTTYTFDRIEIIGAENSIKYCVQDAPPVDEPFIVNNGLYRVTEIKFKSPGYVKIEVQDYNGQLQAGFPQAFQVVGAPVYSLSFNPAKLTAGLQQNLQITITENGQPATDVTKIVIDGTEHTPSQTNNVYTVSNLHYTEAKVLTVVVTNEYNTKSGTAQIEVALPTLDRTLKLGTTPVEFLYQGQEYRIEVTVKDALGGDLNGYLWLGTYSDTTFNPVLDPVQVTNGAATFTFTPTAAGTLVWKVGYDNNLNNAALLLSPSITVVEPTALEKTFNQGFQLLSIPVRPTNPDPAQVFDEARQGDVLVLFIWDPSQNKYLSYMNGEITSVDPGRGYWLYVWTDNTTIAVQGDFPEGDYEITLPVAGWHMVSTPKWPVAWGNVKFSDGTTTKTLMEALEAGWLVPYAFLWTGTAYAAIFLPGTTASMDPWMGYWIRTEVANLKMIIPLDQPYEPPLPGLSLLSLDQVPAGLVPPAPPSFAGLARDMLTVLAYPNPATASTVTFRALGLPVEGIRVSVFDLGGRRVWAGEARGAELAWNLADSSGRPLANGVYLYVVEARLGGQWVSTGLQRLLILR